MVAQEKRRSFFIIGNAFILMRQLMLERGRSGWVFLVEMTVLRG
jgi:hypothetical protein